MCKIKSTCVQYFSGIAKISMCKIQFQNFREIKYLRKLVRFPQFIKAHVCAFLFPDAFSLAKFNLMLGKYMFFLQWLFFVLRSSVLIYFSVCCKLTGDGN